MKTSFSKSYFIKNAFIKNEDNDTSALFPNINIKGSNTIKLLRVDGKKIEFEGLNKYIADYIIDNFGIKIDIDAILPKGVSNPSLVKKTTMVIKNTEYIQVLQFNIKKPEYEVDIDIYVKNDNTETFVFNISGFNKVGKILEYNKKLSDTNYEVIEFELNGEGVTF